jgi:hypothetical protein
MAALAGSIPEHGGQIRRRRPEIERWPELSRRPPELVASAGARDLASAVHFIGRERMVRENGG